MYYVTSPATLLLFAGTVIEFKGPNWDHDPITIALPQGKRTSPSDPVKWVELNSVIIFSMSRLDMDNEICELKNENTATPAFYCGVESDSNLSWLIQDSQGIHYTDRHNYFFLSTVLWTFIFCILLSIGGIRFKLKQHRNNNTLNSSVLNRSIKNRFVSTQVSLKAQHYDKSAPKGILKAILSETFLWSLRLD